jgi:hypothetical protein
MTRCNDQGYRWPPAPNHLHQTKPVHRTWHLYAGEDGADVTSALKYANGLVGVRCGNGLKTGIFRHFNSSRANEAFILHHEHDWPLTGNRSAHAVHHCAESFRQGRYVVHLTFGGFASSPRRSAKY